MANRFNWARKQFLSTQAYGSAVFIVDFEMFEVVTTRTLVVSVPFNAISALAHYIRQTFLPKLLHMLLH